MGPDARLGLERTDHHLHPWRTLAAGLSAALARPRWCRGPRRTLVREGGGSRDTPAIAGRPACRAVGATPATAEDVLLPQQSLAPPIRTSPPRPPSRSGRLPRAVSWHSTFSKLYSDIRVAR